MFLLKKWLTLKSVLVRFLVYGWLGLTGELFFYFVVHNFHLLPFDCTCLFPFEWRIDGALSYGSQSSPGSALLSHVSLWMFVVYGIIAVAGLEPVMKRYRYLWPWWVRAFVYGGIVITLECIFGWVLFALTGLRIWFYSDPLSVLQFTTLLIFPHWMAISLGCEKTILSICHLQEVGVIPGSCALQSTNVQPMPMVKKEQWVQRKPRHISSSPPEAVVVVHGLWLSKGWMQRIKRRLSLRGYHTVPFEFGTWSESCEAVVERLCDTLHQIQAPRVHVVAHSIGGCYALRAMSRALPEHIGKVILIGSPVNGSRLGRIARDFGLSKWVLGKQEQICISPAPSRVAEQLEVGTIVGTMPVGIGSLLWNPGVPSDGMIRVSETHLSQANDSVRVCATHVGLMFAGSVLMQVEAFLRDGTFMETNRLPLLSVVK